MSIVTYEQWEPVMTELLSRFNAGELIALVAVMGGLLCGIVAIVMGSWVEIRKTETKAALKREMLSRGMSAEEICAVIEAGSSRRHCKKGNGKVVFRDEPHA